MAPNPRQLPIMLQLVFELSQVLDNTLALFAFRLVSHITHGAMQVVNRASLTQQNQHFPLISLRRFKKTHHLSYQNHWPPVVRRHIGKARLVGGQVFRYMMYGGVSLAFFLL